MNWKATNIFIWILGLLCLSQVSFGQQKSKPEKFSENHSPFGKRSKEKGMKAGRSFKFSLFKKKVSNGNADEFASRSHSVKVGLFKRLFGGGGKETENASLRKTKPGNVQNKEQRRLFRRSRTKGEKSYEKVQNHQNSKRSKNRKRGVEVFQKKKR